MENTIRDRSRFFRHLLWGGVVVLGQAVPAHLAYASPETRIVIGDDRGGLVSQRQAQVERLRQQGMRVEIRGQHCLSSCTMLLDLPNLCVHPRTRFGFHGPQGYGSPLLPAQFEHWSQIIARHYPPRLRAWYLRVARHRVNGYHTLTGTQLSSVFGINLCKGPQSSPKSARPHIQP